MKPQAAAGRQGADAASIAPETTHAPRYKMLCAVWGKTYIDRFALLSLASLLAEGNLPALGGPEHAEVVLLTGAKDAEWFEALPLMDQLRRHASVRYVSIDDLIVPGQYSVTLTLAFFRGVKMFEDEATQTHFIFWNADFILSKGGLRHLDRLARAGQRLIMTGTLRALSPFAERALLATPRQPDGSLAVEARALVRLALDFPQHHFAAKVVNQTAAWSNVATRVLWRAGGDLLIGRFFQAFMLCLAPTRLPAGINGPCDYSFMPELCPDEPVHMIQDSDLFFALEVGEADQDRQHVVLGPRPDETARWANMSEWLTREHALTADQDVVFRADEVEAEAVDHARAGLRAYHEAFMAGAPKPVSHANPYYWTWGVAAWRERREATLRDAPLPPELADTLSLDDLRSPTYALLYQSRVQSGAGRFPRRLSGWRPSATALNLAEDAAAHVAADPEHTLIVAPVGSHIDRHYPAGASAPHRIEPNVAAAWRLTGAGEVQRALIWQTESGPRELVRLLNNMAEALAPGAPIKAVTFLSDPLQYPDWIEEQRRGALPLFGLLDDLEIAKVPSVLGQARYERGLRRAYQGWRHDPRVWMKGWALVKAGLAAGQKLAVRRLGPPTALIVTGRWRARRDG